MRVKHVDATLPPHSRPANTEPFTLRLALKKVGLVMIGSDGEERICSRSAAYAAPSPSAEKRSIAQEDASASLALDNICSQMIEQHNSQSKAIHDLPPELIISILEAVLSDSINLPYYLGGGYLSIFKDLAMVCTRWKSIIQTTPSFWTVI
ncbi:hypothetical protein FRC04_005286, partial [Tulasnella sp. 424]